MRTLIVLNDPPYGTERSYNGVRLAGAIAKRPEESVRVFLIGDAAACAKSGQTTPQGYYNLGRMLQVVSSNRGDVGVCGTCMDARGIKDAELLDGARRSTPETADGRAGLGTGNFYAEPVPQVRLHPPSRWWHWGKVLFERRWLGRIDREPR